MRMRRRCGGLELLAALTVSLAVGCPLSPELAERTIMVELGGYTTSVSMLDFVVTKGPNQRAQVSHEYDRDSYALRLTCKECAGDYRVQVIGRDTGQQRVAAGECLAQVEPQAVTTRCELTLQQYVFRGRSIPFPATNFKAVHGFDNGDLWIAGELIVDGAQQAGLLLRAPGGRWPPESIPVRTTEQTLRSTTQSLQALWGTAPGELLAAGLLDVFYNDGMKVNVEYRRMVRWRESALMEIERLSKPPEIEPSVQIRGLYGQSVKDLWLVGDLSAVYRIINDERVEVQAPLAGAPTAYAVQGCGINGVWIVGEQATVLRWDGLALKPAEPAPPISIATLLRGIWCTPNGGVWIAGHDSTLLHYWNGTWARVPLQGILPNGTDLYAIWGSAEDDIWVVGTHGTLLHGDGRATWRMVAIEGVSVAASDLHAIWGRSSTDIWVVGSKGAILHYEVKSDAQR